MFGFLRVPFDTDNFWGVKEMINGQHFPAFNSSNKPGRHKQEERKKLKELSTLNSNSVFSIQLSF